MSGKKCPGSACFFANETWLGQHFDATETFSTDSADVSVWELVLELHRGCGQRRQFVRDALTNLLEHGDAA